MMVDEFQSCAAFILQLAFGNLVQLHNPCTLIVVLSTGHANAAMKCNGLRNISHSETHKAVQNRYFFHDRT